MANTEPTIEERLEKLERITFEQSLPDYAIVDADYVARLFSISRGAVVNKRFGTHKIPRCREKPVGFRKADVHRVLRETSKTTQEKAAAEIAGARLLKRKPRKKSIIKKAGG